MIFQRESITNSISHSSVIHSCPLTHPPPPQSATHLQIYHCVKMFGKGFCISFSLQHKDTHTTGAVVFFHIVQFLFPFNLQQNVSIGGGLFEEFQRNHNDSTNMPKH